MGFSEDAIGFYLQVEDQASPALDSLMSKYETLADRIEKQNRRVYQSGNKLTQTMAASVSELSELADQAGRALDTLFERANNQIGYSRGRGSDMAGLVKSIVRDVRRSVAELLSETTLRLTASLPSRRNQLFRAGGSLRSMYAGMTQPPDMRGAFLGLPRFNQGGPVVGPPTPGLPAPDNIPALLREGEYVLTPENLESLLSVLQRAEKVSRKSTIQNVRDMKLRDRSTGQFVGANDIGTLINTIENLTQAAQGWKEVSEAGFDPDAAQNYAKSIEALSVAHRMFDRDVQRLDARSFRSLNQTYGDLIQSSRKLENNLDDTAEIIDDTTDELRGLNRESNRRDGFFAKLFDPRLALASVGFADIAARMSGLRSDVQAGLVDPGIQDVGSFTEEIAELQQRIGRTRPELREIAKDILELSSSSGRMAKDMAAANVALADVGLNTDSLRLSLGRVVLDFDKGAGQAIGTSAEEFYILSQRVGMADESIAAFAATALQQARALNPGKNAGELASQIMESAASFDTIGMFENMGVDAREQFLREFSKVETAMTSLFVSDGSTFGAMLQGAMSGTTEDITKLAMLTGINSPQQIAELLKSQDGASRIIESMREVGIGAQLRGLENADEMTRSTVISGIADQIGMDPNTIAKLAEGLVGSAEAMQTLNSISVDASQGMDQLSNAALDQMTMLEKIQTRIANTVQNIVGFDTPLSALVDYMIELGPLLPVAGAGLLSLGAGAVSAVAGLAGFAARNILAIPATIASIGANAAKSVLSLLSFGKAGATTSAAVGVGAGAGLRGAITGLAGGFAALGNPASLLGIAGVTAAISALALAVGGSAMLAGPKNIKALLSPIKDIATVIGDVAKHGIDSTRELLIHFSEMDGGHLIRVGAGIGAIGIGMIPLVAGLTAMSVVAPILGLLSFNPLKDAGISSMVRTIEMISSSFADMSTSDLKKAATNVLLSGGMLAAFGLATTGMVVGNIGAALFAGADLFMRIFTDKGVFGPLAYASGRIVKTINTLSENFAQIDATKVEQGFDKLTKTLKASALMIGVIAGMSIASVAVSVAAVIDNVVSTMTDDRTLTGFDRMAEIAPALQTTLEKFSTVGSNIDGEQTTKNIRNILEPTGALLSLVAQGTLAQVITQAGSFVDIIAQLVGLRPAFEQIPYVITSVAKVALFANSVGEKVDFGQAKTKMDSITALLRSVVDFAVAGRDVQSELTSFLEIVGQFTTNAVGSLGPQGQGMAHLMRLFDSAEDEVRNNNADGFFTFGESLAQTIEDSNLNIGLIRKATEIIDATTLMLTAYMRMMGVMSQVTSQIDQFKETGSYFTMATIADGVIPMKAAASFVRRIPDLTPDSYVNPQTSNLEERMEHRRKSLGISDPTTHKLLETIIQEIRNKNLGELSTSPMPNSMRKRNDMFDMSRINSVVGRMD